MNNIIFIAFIPFICNLIEILVKLLLCMWVTLTINFNFQITVSFTMISQLEDYKFANGFKSTDITFYMPNQAASSLSLSP